MKKRIKIVLIISIIIVLIGVLGTIFAMVDYNRLTNGKDPIFSRAKLSYQLLNVVSDDNSKEDDSSNATIYHGLGYKIVACDYCKKAVQIMPFGVGTYPYSFLTCTREFAINDKHILEYTFMDGKMTTISTTIVIPEKDIADAVIYEREFNKINDIKGCSGGFKKNVNTYGKISYTTSQSCDLAKMSDEDIKAVYLVNRDSLEQTSKEIIRGYKDNPDMKCKESIAK